jgi:hypothetical protein
VSRVQNASAEARIERDAKMNGQKIQPKNEVPLVSRLIVRKGTSAESLEVPRLAVAELTSIGLQRGSISPMSV